MSHFKAKIYFYLIRVLKIKTKKLTLSLFGYLSQETWLNDLWKLIYMIQSRLYNSFTQENSKMFNITSRYFSIFNNKPPTSWEIFLHVTCVRITVPCSNYQSWKLSDFFNLWAWVSLQKKLSINMTSLKFHELKKVLRILY